MSRSLQSETGQLKCVFKHSPQMSVGQIKQVSCKSQKSIPISQALRLHFLNPAHKHALKILQTEQINSTEILLSVTGYKAGSYSQAPFIISSSKANYTVQGLSWEVTSILNPKTQNEIKLYPPKGPWQEDLPYWYLSAWGLLGLLAFSFLIAQVIRFFFKRKLLQKIKDKTKGETPLKYFIQQMAHLFRLSKKDSQNKESFISKLETMFLDYLENELLIPYPLPDTELDDTLKKIKKLNLKKERKTKLQMIHKEIKKASSEILNYSEKDLNQLLDLTREWIFDYESSKGKR